MAFTTRQAASEQKSAQEAAAKPSAQLFSDQRASTSVQLKQQQLMQTAQLAAEEEEPLQGKFETAQLAAEEEEPLQGKFATAQLAGMEEEVPMQGKFATAQLAALEEEPLQGKFVAQRAEEEEPLQGKFESPAPAQREQKPNNTGMPDNLKSGIENLSGYSMDDVKVHYNSDKPAQLNAHAYAQGTDIHVAPGQEQHLPHEAWHVVQQKQGRVQATMQMKAGVPVNDDAGLENEADVMGAKAVEQQTLAVQSAPFSLKALSKSGPKQLMSVRTVNKVPTVELSKHLVPLANQEAWATSKAKPKTTFISDSAEVVAAVNTSTHDFTAATAVMEYKEIKPTITTTQYEKTPAGDGPGKPVTRTLDAAPRECVVGVTKKAGVDEIVINHLANV
ncbi:DUF4157 domain-containing protein [Cellvibrio sp. KY-GH-1]|uniref:eCIS core domain-containing protein n=1 Tax=Cellvibrio sp. KY-GH-1 TaxID=2303332 RepID=UPI0012493978|nr:DUF4157 domain-containing protein [Cellvibrio sp. KY-GH-1]QEY17608.1 DUF4157 domain-containing protein [Cellvibrio sp. KY-GH-1]